MSESEKTHLSLLEHPPAKSPPQIKRKKPTFPLVSQKISVIITNHYPQQNTLLHLISL